jgi:arginine/lysine/histidine transport system permease protein
VDLFLIWKHKAMLLKGTLVTLELTSGAITIGLILGVIAGMGVISQNRFYRTVSDIYVQLIRGTPILLQIFFFFLGVPQIYYAVTGNSISPDPVMTGMIALGFNSGAYTAEIIRAGIQAIPTGQSEASHSLGLSDAETMRHIILPQALRRMVPPLLSELIVLLKDSALVSTIGVMDLMFTSKLLGAKYYNYVPFLVGAGAIYLFFTIFLSRALKVYERKYPIRK